MKYMNKENISKIKLTAALFLLSSITGIANGWTLKESDIDGLSKANIIYEDKIDISYLEQLVIQPKDDWLGIRVFESQGVCYEQKKDMVIKVVPSPFANLYRAANLPKEIEIGKVKNKISIVDCGQFKSIKTIIK